MSVEEDLAICFANLKVPGDKDYIATAQALKRLKTRPQYSSNRKLGEALGVSDEIVREFLTLLELPDTIRARFGPGGLKLEHGRRLATLTRRHPELQRSVAEAMDGLSAHDARDLVEYVLDHPDIDADEARTRILESKTTVTSEYHVIAILSEAEYRALTQEARKEGTSVNSLVTSVVRDWLAGRD